MASRFLYLVRHGEAAGGGGLSDAGEEQARRTGERLKNLRVDRIHHSPLPRAAQTARLIAGWFIAHALHAPDWRWIGLNQQNCALTVILYRSELPPALVSFNDAAHLPD